MKDTLENKISKLTPDERKLVVGKLRSLVNDPSTNMSSEGPKKLVAYIKPEGSFDMDALKSHLKEQLPDYMIPSSIHIVEDIPLLPNGKVDKNALSSLKVNKDPEDAVQQPLTKTEEQLVAIWEEILDFAPISTKDNFFEVGGDSLLAIRMFWMIEKKIGVKLAPTALYDNPTVSGIAKHLGKTSKKDPADWKFLIPLRKEGDKNPLFCIHGGEGHVLFYRDLPKYLDRDRPVYTVQPKGINGGDLMHETIEEMAKDYISEIEQAHYDGPVNLLYFCYSALVVEMTRQLQALGRSVNLIVVDSYAGTVHKRPKRTLAKRLNTYAKNFVRNPFTTFKNSVTYRYRKHLEPYYIRLTGDKVSDRLRNIRKQLNVVQNRYSWEKFDANCSIILSKRHPKKLIESMIYAWKFWCLSDVNVLYTPGAHLQLFEEPNVKKLGVQVEEVCQ